MTATEQYSRLHASIADVACQLGLVPFDVRVLVALEERGGAGRTDELEDAADADAEGPRHGAASPDRGEDMTDVWAEPEPEPDQRVERVAVRLFYMFSLDHGNAGPKAWDRLGDVARESWRRSARQVLKDADRDA